MKIQFSTLFMFSLLLSKIRNSLSSDPIVFNGDKAHFVSPRTNATYQFEIEHDPWIHEAQDCVATVRISCHAKSVPFDPQKKFDIIGTFSTIDSNEVGVATLGRHANDTADHLFEECLQNHLKSDARAYGDLKGFYRGAVHFIGASYFVLDFLLIGFYLLKKNQRRNTAADQTRLFLLHQQPTPSANPISPVHAERSTTIDIPSRDDLSWNLLGKNNFFQARDTYRELIAALSADNLNRAIELAEKYRMLDPNGELLLQDESFCKKPTALWLAVNKGDSYINVVQALLFKKWLLIPARESKNVNPLIVVNLLLRKII